MLKPEEAQKRLGELKAKPDQWVEQRAASLTRAPDSVRATARLLLGLDEKGQQSRDGRQRQRRRSGAARRLRRMDERELLGVVSALFPKLTTAAAAAMRVVERMPYQRGYMRKPFRAGTHLDLVHNSKLVLVSSMIEFLDGHDPDPEFIAAWAAHLASWNQQPLGVLLAGAIDAGGPEADGVYQILCDSASGLHEVGQMGRHVTSALLCSNRRDGWSFCERLLLAAQRQEGLRQTILETVDEAHPDAFRHMLRVVLDNDLARCAATTRAADVWFGLRWDAVGQKVVEQTIRTAVEFLDDPSARATALDGADAERAYLALWAQAFDDGPGTVAPAAKLLDHAKPEMRFAGAHMLGLLFLNEADTSLLPVLDDKDLRVVAAAVPSVVRPWRPERRNDSLSPSEGVIENDGPDAEEILELTHAAYGAEIYLHRANASKLPPAERARMGRVFPKLQVLFERLSAAQPSPVKPLVWPWMKPTITRGEVASAMASNLGDRSPAELIPYLPELEPWGRARVVEMIAGIKPWDEQVRATILRLVGDPSGNVRERAVAAMKAAQLTSIDAEQLEPLLTRKAEDLRRGVLELLLKQDDASVLASADRLTSSKSPPQRLAGLELLRRLVNDKRVVDAARARAEAYAAYVKQPSSEEQTHFDAIRGTAGLTSTTTLDDALGLMDPRNRTAPAKPRRLPVAFSSPVAEKLLKSLDALVHEHRNEQVSLGRTEETKRIETLGSIRWGFPPPIVNTADGKHKADPAALPLKDVWVRWWTNRPADVRDVEGMEAVWALRLLTARDEDNDDADDLAYLDGGKAASRAAWFKQLRAATSPGKRPKVKYEVVLEALLGWMVLMYPPTRLADHALDQLEAALALVPVAEIRPGKHAEVSAARAAVWPAVNFATNARTCCKVFGSNWEPDHEGRLFRLLRFLDEPSPGWPRKRPDFELVIAAFAAGAATPDDLYDQFLGPPELDAVRRWRRPFYDLVAFSGRTKTEQVPEAVRQIVDRCRQRVIEVELRRGEQETPVTDAAQNLKYAGGMDTLVAIVRAMGADRKLARGHQWGSSSRGVVFSHLIRVCTPAPDDTPERFARAVAAAKVGQDTLVALACYAPQWAAHVEVALGWPGLEQAVWWIHAHTKDRQWSVEESVREQWTAAVRQRTPLEAADLHDGAVDVAWFHRTYEQLGAKRWTAVYEQAKYASGGAGHRRAQLFADAMLAKLKRTQLVKDVTSKRNQDGVRALGLLPLGKGDAARNDLHDRYKVLQEFVRTSRQFGSMRQASEKRAAAIGQENLARTAGYPDPVRLQWAMEAESSKDLAKGPVSVKAKDVVVTLSIDADGLPTVEAVKGGRTLKDVPPAARKDPKVKELCERRTDLKRSASRMRQSLEMAMCRGDTFEGRELRELAGNPVLGPMLQRVVFLGEGITGYPIDDGRGLCDHAGKIEPIKPSEQLRIAHPHDLLVAKAWPKWQRECLAAERVQPFKQVFRELYVPTKQERDDRTASKRYAGHQVNPRQAMALLGGRGWVAAPEAGVFRTFHDAGLTAWVSFEEYFHTPAEVEGLTLDAVHFTRRGEHKPTLLAEVEPRLFSEVMRDLDLVVSVAHRGGVDPEASASTVELRATLVRETIALLKLKNVRIKEPHALIEGSLGEYDVHLGSGTAHILPGGALFIVPVHAQHRGRLFLPFADDDPKTAEVVSKVLLLARDQEIRDTNLLDQIRAVAT